MPRGWIPQNDEQRALEAARLHPRPPKPIRRWYQFTLRLTAVDVDEAWLLALAVRDQGRTIAPDLNGAGKVIEVPFEERRAR
jgi:hypothetical protein